MVILVKKKKGPTETCTYKVTAISCQDQGKPNTQLQGYRENGNYLLPLLGYGERHEDKWTNKREQKGGKEIKVRKGQRNRRMGQREII
jgi:hypothetical protein